jgi:hypothetical protein
MIMLADLEQFVIDHRPHGTLTGDATASRPRMRSRICWKLRS